MPANCAFVCQYDCHPSHCAGGPESPVVKMLLGGFITLVLEVSGGHFVEMLKIKKQV